MREERKEESWTLIACSELRDFGGKLPKGIKDRLSEVEK